MGHTFLEPEPKFPHVTPLHVPDPEAVPVDVKMSVGAVVFAPLTLKSDRRTLI
jgi:hypothetical protein